MTLQAIRETKETIEILPAIKFLCDNMQAMTWGEYNAYKRTLELQALKLGVSIKELNAIAEQYQIFGNLEVSNESI